MRHHPTRSPFLLLLGLLLLASCRTPVTLRPLAPAQGAIQQLHYPVQQKFIAMPREARRLYFADKASRQELKSQGFWPRPVTLLWEDTGADGADSPVYTLHLSYDPGFAEGTCQTFTTHDTRLEVTNLRIATTYYWKVQAGSRFSPVSSFVTEDTAPRLLRIPNAWNARDLGGRIGWEGRRIRQDKIIRTGGLNNNATPVYWTQAELQDNPKFQAIFAALKEQARPLHEAPLHELPYLLDGEWTAFLPAQKRYTQEQIQQALALTEIPETFLGAPARKVSMDDACALRFPDCDDSKPALFMKEFLSPADGVMPFQCGADWYWMLCLNGNVLYDRMVNGNTLTSAVDNYTLFLPVKKGRNLLVIPLGSGSGGFAWFMGPAPKGIRLEEVLARGRAENEAIFTNRHGLVKTDAQGNPIYIPGASVLTEEGLDYLLNTLKLKTEIDLRTDQETYGMAGSPAGDSVAWRHIPSAAYAAMQNESGRKAFAQVFSLFLDEQNYPIDFHCIAGQDRTGAVAFILNALLGVEEDELFLDWECTGFWNPNPDFRHELLFDKLIAGFQKYPGESLREKVENYVLSLGFTRQDIRHFREIMLE